MDSREYDEKFLELVPESVQYTGPADLPQYFVKKVSIEASHTDPERMKKKGVIVKFSFGRNLLNELMTTYIPTVLLVFISYATSFYERDLFETVIAVNLTCMLVLGEWILATI